MNPKQFKGVVLALTIAAAFPVAAQVPELPEGLGDLDLSLNQEAEPEAPALAIDVTGFMELRAGLRLQGDPSQKAASLGETRAQIDAERAGDRVSLRLVADFLFDALEDRHSLNLEAGRGWLDLRQANILWRATGSLDVKLGRQILTWGTGDLLFINDLFPKDWKAFFIGRDVEYLKAPSDAVKFAFFSEPVNIDVVYTPRFDADRFIDGRRLSFFNPALGRLTGRDAPVVTAPRERWFNDDELAVRAYRAIGSFEAALYGYRGYWKSPAGQDPATGQAIFPRLNVYGASLRGPLGAGIAQAELGFYDSRDDRQGIDPLVRNSEFRALVGYEWELMPEFTVGVQYYAERRFDQPLGDATRHLLSLRLTKLAMNQNLILSAFNFYSPSDHDGYLRLRASYKLSDAWLVETGANMFYGRRLDSFLGQFETNSNVFFGARRSF